MRRVPEQAHVHEQRDGVLCLTKVLEEVRCGFALAFALVVWHVDELVVVLEPGICGRKLRRGDDRRKIAEIRIPPLVELCYRRTCSSLLVQHYGGNSQANESEKKRLFEVCILSKGNVLDDRGVLEVVSAKNDPL